MNLRLVSTAFVLLAVALASGSAEARSSRRGKLRVSCSIDGAEVLVDGKVVATTPMREVSVSSGRHGITVRKLGYLEFADKVTIRTGKTEKVVVDLLPTAGVIRVSANAPRAYVTVDGQRIGDAPVVREVKVGTRLVAVNAPGYKPYTQKIRAEPGKTYVIDANLVREGGDDLDLAAIPLAPAAQAPADELALVAPDGGDGLALEPLSPDASAGGDAGSGDGLALEALPGLESLPPEEITATSPDALAITGQPGGVSATVTPGGKPWYMEWWAWSAAGAVVVGVATAVMLSNSGSSSEGCQADKCAPFDSWQEPPKAATFRFGF